MNKTILVTAAILGTLGVIAGAFGAHALKDSLTPAQLETWRTAVQYQFYHVFALLFLGTYKNTAQTGIKICYWFFLAGIIFFSGSLYLLACRDMLNLQRLLLLGVLTPIGGVFFITGWVFLAVAAFKSK